MNKIPVRFLADESCDMAIAGALRAQGYDVVVLNEFTSRSVDSQVITQTFRDKRILLTEDRDFAQLAFGSNPESAGIILMRFQRTNTKKLQEAITRLIEERGSEVENAFVVMQPSHIRISHKS
jgi:predicted nuclease of predicted toxin-antitoxin system